MEVFSLRYDPRFMEETVFHALRGYPESWGFEKERNRLYELADAEERERAFQALNVAWFDQLGMAKPIEKAVRERPLVSSSAKCCVVSRAPGKKEEGAELFVSSEEGLSEKDQRTVRILLRPESLLQPEILLTFLRHELLHVADMLDPNFGYEPELPAVDGGPTHDRLLIDRYRTLWDATIDGRLTRLGWLYDSVRARRLSDFCRAFPMFGELAEAVFSRFFDREPHTHAELVAFALNPRSVAEGSTPGFHAGTCCPLCGFLTHTFEPKPASLPPDVVTQITQDYPRWDLSQGLCVQCADLYRTHALSARAAACLPGSRAP